MFKILFYLSSQAILSARSRIFHKLLYQQQASPQRKNQGNPPPVRENKLRLFLKRSSEPLLNIQNESQKVSLYAGKGWKVIFNFRKYSLQGKKMLQICAFVRLKSFEMVKWMFALLFVFVVLSLSQEKILSSIIDRERSCLSHLSCPQFSR